MHLPRRATWLAAALVALGATAQAEPEAPKAAEAVERRVLFIGNSFTFGAGSLVQRWRAASVKDLNGEGIGGVPALFKAFAEQAGLNWQVGLETRGGAGLDFHYKYKRERLAQQRWDVVVMHGHSTLDARRPGDPTLLLSSSQALGEWFKARNPQVELHLLATWSRADQTYRLRGPWSGQPIDAMARDVRRAYDEAAAQAGARSVIPVGEAWALAMQRGVADANPYDGITPGQMNLWADDHYHASARGSYLAALVVFAQLSGVDPRALGEGECAAFELGLAAAETTALQQVAHAQLASVQQASAQPASLQPASLQPASARGPGATVRPAPLPARPCSPPP